MPSRNSDPSSGAERTPSPGPTPLPHRGPPATAEQMKAFTHPLRMQLYRLLSDQGQATASTLARATGESTGQTSYHLRQLEKFGFIEEVPGAGTARERWWRARSFSYDRPEDPGDPTTRAVGRWIVENQSQTLADAAERWHLEPTAWREASTMTSSTVWLTHEQLSALTEDLLEVLDRHTTGATEAHAADQRRVRVYLSTLPLPEE